MTLEDHTINLMRYFDNEMDTRERAVFERHLETCEQCRAFAKELMMVKEVTDTVKIARLPEAVWDSYWTSVYNRLERSVAWFLFIVGAIMLTCFALYKAVTDPGLHTFAGLGGMLMVVGFAVLFLSVLREKIAVNKVDKYISEVKR